MLYSVDRSQVDTVTCRHSAQWQVRNYFWNRKELQAAGNKVLPQTPGICAVILLLKIAIVSLLTSASDTSNTIGSTRCQVTCPTACTYCCRPNWQPYTWIPINMTQQQAYMWYTSSTKLCVHTWFCTQKSEYTKSKLVYHAFLPSVWYVPKPTTNLRSMMLKNFTCEADTLTSEGFISHTLSHMFLLSGLVLLAHQVQFTQCHQYNVPRLKFCCRDDHIQSSFCVSLEDMAG